MLHDTAPVLFESTDAMSVLRDPANQEWLAVLEAVSGERFGMLERRYYLAVAHFRRSQARPSLPGRFEVIATGMKQALQGVLEVMGTRKKAEKQPAAHNSPAIFVDPCPDDSEGSLPRALADFSVPPPPFRDLLEGPGRPPVDGLCLLRAFLAAPVLGVGDSPTAVDGLLRSNPTFARACGFLGRDAPTPPGALTSRRLPSLSKLEDFSEVMTRYGLWRLAAVEQVQENLANGVVAVEDTLAFDTTHIEANSHCGNVVPPDVKVQDGKKPKHRKVPRLRKTCSCGRQSWENCEHPWVPTDQGAAIVVKGPTRIYWAHKVSVATFGDSEIPIDARALQYGAEHDGKTLVPHLELLDIDFPAVTAGLRHVLADDAYQGNPEEVARFGRGARLNVPVHPSGNAKAPVAAQFASIARVNPLSAPVCAGDHRLRPHGRAAAARRDIWAAPDDDNGLSVCAGCPFAADCGLSGTRRHIRVQRDDFPQIDWDQPQHLTRNRERYQRRTGVERAIKRLKVDLGAEHLTHRDSLRVQAHLDRRLLVLHLLLESGAGGTG